MTVYIGLAIILAFAVFGFILSYLQDTRDLESKATNSKYDD